MIGSPFPEGLDSLVVLRKLEHYCRAAGIPGHLIDSEGAVLGAFDQAGRSLDTASKLVGCCPVCAVLGPEELAEERRAQLYIAYQAERFGGSYIQLCPHSFMLWAAPLVVDGLMRASYIGGPLMIVEAAEVYEELRAAGKLPAGLEEAVLAALETAPRVPPQRAASLAEVLAELAASALGSSPLADRREREEQQRRISENIHEIKEAGEGKGRSYPIEKERELLLSISQGDRLEAQALLNEILGHIFFSSGQDAPVIKARVLELVVLLSRAALEGGADVEQIFGLNFTYLNQIQRMRSVDEIAVWLSRIMVRFSELVFGMKDVKHAVVMQKALRYINSHYAEEMTLDDVAGAVFLSPTYFSKLFSEEMACRFTVYLNKVRIEKSKLLLKSTDISLVDLAGLVGYEDQSYFTRVFKRIVGISPGRYRESGGRLASDNQEIHES